MLANLVYQRIAYVNQYVSVTQNKKLVVREQICLSLSVMMSTVHLRKSTNTPEMELKTQLKNLNIGSFINEEIPYLAARL